MIKRFIYKHLPATDGSFPCSKLLRKIRSSVGKHLFDSCGDNINIDKNANFGNGRGDCYREQFRIGHKL